MQLADIEVKGQVEDQTMSGKTAPPQQPVQSTNQTITGTDEKDVILGGDGHDVIRGMGGNDILEGGAGNDTLEGGEGNDTLEGGAGEDVFSFSPGDGHDTIKDFKPGTDKIDLSGFSQGIAWFDLRWNMEATSEGVKIDLSKWGGGSITLTGVNSPNDLGEDMFFLTDASIFRTGGSGSDSFVGSEDGDHLAGGLGDDYLYGNRGADELKGDEGDDFIVGGQGDDRIVGGAGDDTLYGDGNTGDTHYRDGAATGETDRDTFYYGPGDGNDKIMDFNNGEDSINLTEFTAISGFGDINARQDGANVVIDFSDKGGGSITLVNFSIDNLDASDFEFHTSSVDAG